MNENPNDISAGAGREAVLAHLRSAGKKGGDETKRRHGKEHYENLGREGALKRWGSKEV